MDTETCARASSLPDDAPVATASAKWTLLPRRVHRPMASKSSPGATDRYCNDMVMVVSLLPRLKS